MKIIHRHDWDLSPAEARALQPVMAKEIRTDVPLPPIRTIAATDVSFDRGSDILFAAVVVVDARTFAVVEAVGVTARATFPYIPGFLSFREAPALLEAFARVESEPDVVLCDGQGIAHPRRLGIASHLGLWLDCPTVGSAKSKLWGHYDEPGPDRGDTSPLLDRGGEVIGTVLRSRPRSNPLFVSPGNRCDQASALALVLSCLDGRRIPVPIRMVHDEVNRLRRAAKGEAAEGIRDAGSL